MSGVCADCWAPKEPGGRPVFSSEQRTWPLFDWDFGLFGIDGGFRFAALAIGLVALVVAAALGLR